MALTIQFARPSHAAALFNAIDYDREHLHRLVWAKDATEKSVEAFIFAKERTSDYLWVIILNEIPIGLIEYRATGMMGNYNIGYWLGKEHCGKGIMTRAIRLTNASTLVDGDLLTASIRPDNSTSQSVLEKIGFFCVQLEGNEWKDYLFRYVKT